MPSGYPGIPRGPSGGPIQLTLLFFDQVDPLGMPDEYPGIPGGSQWGPMDITLLFLIEFSKYQVLLRS